jgi:pyruvate/2-oxoglutarate dehydrogenase complex dihydrolipoamide dehydrogenase (E3) component
MSAYELVVIGGGPAGVTAALRARELGVQKVALVERGLLGGTCTNDGCAPTRVLAKAARLIRDAEQFSEYGLTALRPELDIKALLSRTQQVVYQLQEKKQIVGHLQDVAVDVHLNKAARFADPHTLTFPDSTTLQGERFVIAAGGRARRLDIPGIEHTITHSDVWRMEKLPKSIAIVGSGATGCQVASIFEAFGATVTLLDLVPRILPTEDAKVSEVIAAEFIARGIQIITGIGGVTRIDKESNTLTLHYANAEKQPAQLQAEAVLMSVGWPGNADTLQPDAAGIQTKGGFIVVNDHLQTTTPHIYAAGDITGRMMLVQTAIQQARIAAENAINGADGIASHALVPHGGFTDPEYGSVGLTEEQAKDRNCVAATVNYADMDRAVIDGRPAGFCKLIVNRDDHTIIGAHVVGEQAVEVVQIAAATMASGGRIDQLAGLDFAYPTFAAILGVAARQISRELKLTPVAQEWYSLTRRRIGEWERTETVNDEDNV